MNYEDGFKEIEQLCQKGEIERSIVLLQGIEKQAKKEENMAILLKAWQWLIRVYQYQGWLDRAIGIADTALKLIKDKNSAGYCDILRRRGFIYYLKGNAQQFLLDVNSALEIAEKNNYELERAGCLGVLGIYYQDTGRNFEKALEYLEKAREIRRSSGDTEGEAKVLINLGTLYRGKENFFESKRYLERAIQITKDKRLKINCHLELGRAIHILQNYLLEAKKEVELALQLALPTRFVNEQADCYRELARITFEEGDKEKSRDYYQKALEIYKKYGYSAKAEAIEEEIAKRF